jgi:hypothetical protein
MDLSPLSLCASAVKGTRPVEPMWDETAPMPNQAVGDNEIRAPTSWEIGAHLHER